MRADDVHAGVADGRMPRHPVDPARTEGATERGDVGERGGGRVHREDPDPALEGGVEAGDCCGDLVGARLTAVDGAVGQRRRRVPGVDHEEVGVADRGESAEQVVAHLDAEARPCDDARECRARLDEGCHGSA